MDVAESDDALQTRGQDRARHATDLARLVRAHDAARDRDGGIRIERQADQPFRHAAAAAVQDTDDDLLTDVAAFGQADGAILDARFERNRLCRHILPKHRSTALDASHLDGRGIRRPSPGLTNRLRQRAGGGPADQEIKPRHPDIVSTSDDERVSVPVNVAVAKDRQRV